MSEIMRTHMDKVGATYYHRRVVPEEIRPYFRTANGKIRTEFKTSLRTKDRREADRRIEREEVRVTALFDAAYNKLRAGLAPDISHTMSDAWDDYERQLEALDNEVAHETSQQEFERAEEDDALALQLDRPADALTKAERAIKRNLAPTFFEDAESVSAKKQAWNQGAEIGVKRFAAIRSGRPPLEQSSSLFDLLGLYARNSGSQAATIKRWRTVIEHLVRFLGYDDARRITRADIVKWRDFLITEKTKTGVRKPKTIRDTYLPGAKAALAMGVDYEIIETNPAAGVKGPKDKHVLIREDKGFTEVEVVTILSGTLGVFSERIPPETRLAYRWVPWVCAYTGARVNEITQLREGDIVQVAGIWCIKITPEAGGVKNGKIRTVPLHQHLIDQGFHTLSVASSLKPLFYSPKRSRTANPENPHYKKVGERIAKWVRSLGIPTSVAPSHGWRHLFRTRGHDAGIPEEALEAILGHAPSNEAKKYGQWSVTALNREVSKLPYFPVTTPAPSIK